MRQLALLATGGTIATRAGAQGRQVAVGAADLLSAARGVHPLDHVHVHVHDTAAILSSAATVPDVLSLAGEARRACAEADGVVITHGTDTMEESAFLLSLTHAGSAPVVFTGAQRPFDDAAADGPRNLSAALRWAAAEEAADTGVSVAFADRILPAVGARKVHSLDLAAFDAPGRGPVGRVDETGVRKHAHPQWEPLLGPDVADLPRVDVIGQYLGADGGAVDHAVASGAQGLVLAGFGAGNATPATVDACRRHLTAGLPVLVTTRTGAGPVAPLYSGGGVALAEAGALLAGDLPPWQARLLLAAALACEGEPRRAVVRCERWLRAVGALPST
ncbi:asparaginase [Salinifilum ghardaiensis]